MWVENAPLAQHTLNLLRFSVTAGRTRPRWLWCKGEKVGHVGHLPTYRCEGAARWGRSG